LADRRVGFDRQSMGAQLRRSRRRQSAERPDGGAANNGGGVFDPPLGLGGKLGPGRIADRDQNIAQEAVASDAFDWRTRKKRSERRVVEARQFR
jgi:hypothetical protein